MSTWYPLEQVDPTFFRTAPLRHEHVVDLDASAREVFDQLASEESLQAWGVGLQLRWTSERPFGVGTTREASLPGGMVLRERFTRWDDGEGYTFEAHEANRATYRRFAEDYRLVDRPGGGCTLTWIMAMEPRSGWHGRVTSVVDRLTAPMYHVVPWAARRYFRRTR